MFNLIYMLQLFKGIALEADSLLNDLQSSLHMQEAKLTAYAHQQREVCHYGLLGELLGRDTKFSAIAYRHMPEQWRLHEQYLK